MVALLVALTLTAGTVDRPPTFEPTLFDASMTAGSGGDAGFGGKLAFVGLGVVGTGGVLVLSLPFLVQTSGIVSVGALLVPMAAAVGLHMGLGALLGVDVSWASASIGAAFGVASSIALGFAFGARATGEFSTDLGLVLLGLLGGYAIGTPLFTLLDPFGVARLGRADTSSSASTLPVETRPQVVASVDPVGMQVALWGGRF